MDNYTVLLALEKMDIGGVETFVITQAEALLKKGYQVIILAKRGSYSKKIEELGAVFIDFDFKIINNFSNSKNLKLTNIIKEYKVNEIHIHQYPLIPYFLSVCLNLNIPYIAYVHSGASTVKRNSNNVFDWYENHFNNYTSFFNLYFKYAYKIIAITEIGEKYVIKRYKVDPDKVFVYKNPLNFDKFTTNTYVTKVTKVFQMCRLSEEYYKYIKAGVELFVEMKNQSSTKLTYTLAGDGNYRDKILELLDSKLDKEDYIYLGKITNVKEVIEKQDLVIGVGRCILEALALKKLTVVASKINKCELIRYNNIDFYCNHNFAKLLSYDYDKKQLAKQIINLKKVQIEKNQSNIYNVIKDKLDVHKNVLVYNVKEHNYNINYYEFINIILDGEKKILEKNLIDKKEIEQIIEENNHYKKIIKNYEKFKLDKIYRLLKKVRGKHDRKV